MIRSIIAILVGLVVGGLLVFGVESIGQLIYPLPEGIDLTDPEAMKTFAENAPVSAKLIVLLAWFVGPLGGGWLAAWIAQRSPLTHALIIGVFFLLADIFNMISIPSPIWFWVGGIVLPLLAAYVAGKAVERQQET